MALMRLAAVVPNAGAHRLAWAIGTAANPVAAFAELEVLIGFGLVERLLDGSLTPGERLDRDLRQWSAGAIVGSDFYRDADRGWFDKPETRAPFDRPYWSAKHAGWMRRIGRTRSFAAQAA